LAPIAGFVAGFGRVFTPAAGRFVAPPVLVLAFVDEDDDIFLFVIDLTLFAGAGLRRGFAIGRLLSRQEGGNGRADTGNRRYVSKWPGGGQEWRIRSIAA
jgi:hypothetical protein